MDDYVLFQTAYKLSTEFNFTQCGWQHRTPNTFFGPAQRDFYLMHFTVDGRGTFAKDGVELPIGKNQGFLIVPYETTVYGADTDLPWEYYWIGFNGSDCKKFLKLCGLDENNRLFSFEGDRLFPLFQRLLQLDISTIHGVLKAQSILLELFSEILILDEVKEEKKKSSDCVKRAIEYLESNFASNPRVSDIAKALYVDRSQLYRMFIKKLGCSPEQYINELKLNKACEVLRYTSIPITVVAEQCGFYSSSLFCRRFKEKYGVTPLSYRRAPFETQ